MMKPLLGAIAIAAILIPGAALDTAPGSAVAAAKEDGRGQGEPGGGGVHQMTELHTVMEEVVWVPVRVRLGVALVLGVAVGVAVVVAIQLASDAALQRFRGTMTTFAGTATHELTAGGPLPAMLARSVERECQLVATTYGLPDAPSADNEYSWHIKNFPMVNVR